MAGSQTNGAVDLGGSGPDICLSGILPETGTKHLQSTARALPGANRLATVASANPGEDTVGRPLKQNAIPVHNKMPIYKR